MCRRKELRAGSIYAGIVSVTLPDTCALSSNVNLLERFFFRVHESFYNLILKPKLAEVKLRNL